jgi:hypothetical protein
VAFAAEIPITLGPSVTGIINTDTGVLTISGTGPMTDHASEVESAVGPYRASIHTVVIENGVTTIGNYTFHSCDQITSITLPESMTRIGDFAFSFSGITSIVIPEGVTSIGASAFYYCEELTTASISSTVENIGAYAFMRCFTLSTIDNLYNGSQTVGYHAFSEAGRDAALKTARLYPANTAFDASATGAGYTIEYIDMISAGDGSIEATVPMNGMINATTISVTHPASVEYVIDPNLGYAGGAFIAPDIAITNNSVVPVNVTIQRLTAEGGDIIFTDVAPDAKDWANLNSTESKTFIALGVKIADSAGWKSGCDTGDHYAIDISNTHYGTLAMGATGHMSMIAKHGLSMDQSFITDHDLVFIFDLA